MRNFWFDNLVNQFSVAVLAVAYILSTVNSSI